jgi:hypothetical protein
VISPALLLTPQLDPRILRGATVVLALILLYGSRMTKGSAHETPAGLAFPIKPLFAWARGIALPVYILFFAYVSYSQHQHIPWWTPLLFLAALAIGLLQMPGTITLTPTAVTQNFWFLRSKSIPYNEVASLQTMQGGRITRVVTQDRIIITHTANHAASGQFQQEIQSRTKKHLIS